MKGKKRKGEKRWISLVVSIFYCTFARAYQGVLTMGGLR